jgi:RNA polymerase sigma-70 factor (ECF subfamily)
MQSRKSRFCAYWQIYFVIPLKKTHYKQYSDEALMVEVMDHQCPVALVELHRRYSSKLVGYFMKMLKNDEALAQDFVQDVFLKILEKNHQFDRSKKFYTWLFTIASNHCKSAFRNNGKWVKVSSLENQANRAEMDPDYTDKHLFIQQLEREINKLEHHHKTVFVLRYLEHFTLNEIADITETSLGTVKSRLFYATQKITRTLKDFDPRMEGTFFKLN